MHMKRHRDGGLPHCLIVIVLQCCGGVVLWKWTPHHWFSHDGVVIASWCGCHVVRWSLCSGVVVALRCQSLSSIGMGGMGLPHLLIVIVMLWCCVVLWTWMLCHEVVSVLTWVLCKRREREGCGCCLPQCCPSFILCRWLPCCWWWCGPYFSCEQRRERERCEVAHLDFCGQWQQLALSLSGRHGT